MEYLAQAETINAARLYENLRKIEMKFRIKGGMWSQREVTNALRQFLNSFGRGVSWPYCFLIIVHEGALYWKKASNGRGCEEGGGEEPRGGIFQ